MMATTPNEAQRHLAGQTIVDHMSEIGMSRRQLATAAEVAESTIRRFIEGTTWPRAELRYAIEIAVGWTPGDLQRAAHGQALRHKGIESWSDDELEYELARRRSKSGARHAD